MKKIFSIAAVLAAFLFASTGAAKADSGTQITYTITGPATNPINATFVIDMFPTVDPDNVALGEGFTIMPVSISVDGTDMAGDLITFYSADSFGGLSDQAGLFSLMNAGGAMDAQMYTGSEANPQMTLYSDPITLTGFQDETGAYDVTVTTSAITTPEPAGLLLLASGIVALCLMRKMQTA